MTDWRAFVPDHEYVSRYVLEEMPDVVDRALRAGARPPLAYQGAGMTSVVLCDDRSAFKVARRASQSLANMLGDEYEWLVAANATPGVRERVARVHRFHPAEVAIERECVAHDQDAHDRWYRTRYSPGHVSLHAIHDEIEDRMIPRGWTAPEFKDDSYVFAARGPVLVDASMAHRVGRVLLRYEVDLLRGRRVAGPHEHPSDGAFYVRREVDRTITPRAAASVLAALGALEAAGNHYPREAALENPLQISQGGAVVVVAAVTATVASAIALRALFRRPVTKGTLSG